MSKRQIAYAILMTALFTLPLPAFAAQNGLASYYWKPQPTASGERFNPNALTAAHRTLPFGTRVRVTNKRNGRSVVVRINDRGPFIRGRIIDLSRRAAGVIRMKGAGIVPVRVTVISRGRGRYRKRR
ncbi:MAG: septal ring lytic transglycosylase RlpA family protein [Pseudomonadota bacterium]